MYTDFEVAVLHLHFKLLYTCLAEIINIHVLFLSCHITSYIHLSSFHLKIIGNTMQPVAYPRADMCFIEWETFALWFHSAYGNTANNCKVRLDSKLLEFLTLHL